MPTSTPGAFIPTSTPFCAVSALTLGLNSGRTLYNARGQMSVNTLVPTVIALAAILNSSKHSVAKEVTLPLVAGFGASVTIHIVKDIEAGVHKIQAGVHKTRQFYQNLKEALPSAISRLSMGLSGVAIPALYYSKARPLAGAVVAIGTGVTCLSHLITSTPKKASITGLASSFLKGLGAGVLITPLLKKGSTH